MTLRLEADAVFTVDDANTVLAPGAVEITDGRHLVGRRPLAGPGCLGHRPCSGSAGILMPGLVNCHGHSPMTLVRSAGDGLPLDRWLSEAVWPREARITTTTSTGG